MYKFSLPRLLLIICLISLTISCTRQKPEHEPLSTILVISAFQLATQLESELPMQNWKKVHQNISPEGDLIAIEWIPTKQSLNDYNEMLTIVSHDLSKQKNRPSSASEFLEVVKKKTFGAYPPSFVKWNVIKRSSNDVTYEWQLLNRFKNIPPQHEILRIIIDKNHLYNIAYTRIGSEIDRESRIKWIHKLESLN